MAHIASYVILNLINFLIDFYRKDLITMNTPTPLIPLTEYNTQIYAKIEYKNPSGSIKHRAIPPFFTKLKENKILKANQTIAFYGTEAAAISTAWFGSENGHPVNVVLPPNATPQSLKTLDKLGAETQQMPSQEASKYMKDLSKNSDAYVLVYPHQEAFINYYRPIATEILAELDNVGAIVVGIGSGISITGIAHEIKGQEIDCQIVGVEPEEADIASGGLWKPHNLTELAPPLLQPLLDKLLINLIAPIPAQEALDCAKEVAEKTGLKVGPSSGATILVATILQEQGISGPIVAICASEAINDGEGPKS